MPQIVHEKPKSSQARPFIAGFLAFVVVAGVIGLVIFLFIKHQEAQATERYNTMVTTTDNLKAHFKYADARQAAADYAKTSPTTKRLCDAYYRQAAYSSQLKDAPAATAAYKQMYQTKGCSKLMAVQGLSAAAIIAGDKATAIMYLKEEITLWPANADLRDLYIQDLKNRIKALGGQL